MIDDSEIVMENVKNNLRSEYADNIYITDKQLSDTPTIFPAVSVVQSNNTIQQQYATFNKLENVASCEYTANIYSNLSGDEKDEETLKILKIISDTFAELRYARTYSEPVTNLLDDAVSRRVARFAKSVVI